MNNKEKQDKTYKKMTRPDTISASPRKRENKTVPLQSRNRKSGTATYNKTGKIKAAAPVELKRKSSTGQILIITLLSLILISLLVLVFFLFQPGRIQLWKDSENPSDSLLVQRLETVEEEQILKPAPVALEEINQPETTEKKTDSQISRDARIYFVKVNAEGQISLKSVTRSVDFSGSPLTTTINTLLSGPGSDEINKGSLTLIPEGSRLLSARVEGGTAYLNFNESFRFNPLGREGYLAQLKQVVYTSTEFSNIKSVQILIEGVIREYLGGEGFYIGEPLSRESFQSSS